MNAALQIYEELKDMDYLDYMESYESDIQFIGVLVQELGASAAREYLQQYFE
ncbi:MAG: hypothetical protein J5725_00540 [Bacteroidales bacterium]|nr:hypothetical protein [Bacteroidales bacterium]